MIHLRLAILLYITLFLSACDWDKKKHKDENISETLIFVPGENRSIGLYGDVAWGEQAALKNFDRLLVEYKKNAPEGLRIEGIPENLALDINWNPPLSLSGKTFPLGNYRLEVAKVEPMKVRIEGKKITLLDKGCFPYSKKYKNGDFELTLLKGNSDKLKKLKIYKVMSELNDLERLVSERIYRHSCIFTANLRLEEGYSYKVRLLGDVEKDSRVHLYGINPGAGQAVFDAAYYDVDANWSRLDKTWPVLNQKSSRGGYFSNLFFVGYNKK